MERPLPQAPGESDGRRRRGQDNRARIVAAMLALIREGEATPSAEQVAERADVALRTVFRHFADMDSLYSRMSEAISAEMEAMAARPFSATDWADRIVELVRRRGEVFEAISPYKRASDAVRHRSRFVAGDQARLARILREILERELPDAGRPQAELVEALDLLLSWESWARLRRDQGLSPEESAKVLEAAVRRLLAKD